VSETLKQSKITKNTVRYDAEDKDKAEVCDTIYIKKSAFEGTPPQEITLALEKTKVTIS